MSQVWFWADMESWLR